MRIPISLVRALTANASTPAMPTIAAFIQLLPAKFKSQPYRSTDGTVYSVVEGGGKVTIGSETFDFEPRDHLDIGTELGLIDMEAGARVSGSRFAYIKGDLVMLELALVRFALDLVRGEGHEPVVPPVLVREEALVGTGFLPGDRDQIYEVPKDELFLVGTS